MTEYAHSASTRPEDSDRDDPSYRDLREASHVVWNEARDLGRAAAHLGQLVGVRVRHAVSEHTELTLGAALGAGFVVGGGMRSYVGRAMFTAARRMAIAWAMRRAVEIVNAGAEGTEGSASSGRYSEEFPHM